MQVAFFILLSFFSSSGLFQTVSISVFKYTNSPPPHFSPLSLVSFLRFKLSWPSQFSLSFQLPIISLWAAHCCNQRAHLDCFPFSDHSPCMLDILSGNCNFTWFFLCVSLVFSIQQGKSSPTQSWKQNRNVVLKIKIWSNLSKITDFLFLLVSSASFSTDF